MKRSGTAVVRAIGMAAVLAVTIALVSCPSPDGGEGPFTVTWKNHDGTVLKTDSVAKGALPAYEGEQPKKAVEATTSYVFSGWSPEPAPVIADAVYTAQFDGEDKIMVTLENGKVTIVNETGKPNATYASLTPKIEAGYNAGKGQTLTSFLNEGSIKLVLGEKDESVLQGKNLIVTFYADVYIDYINDPDIISWFEDMIKDATHLTV